MVLALNWLGLARAQVGTTASPADPSLRTASNAERVVRGFDFEERPRGNLEDIPIGWEKVEGPGLPHYVNGRFDSTTAAEGRFSYRMDLNGGSVVYRYPSGVIPVFHDALYRLSVRVKTTQLEYARATLTAWLADEAGVPIEGSRTQSTPFVSEKPKEYQPDEWKTISIELLVQSRKARWLVVEIGLEQPARLGLSRLGNRDVFLEDIRGSAWFDDLRIVQSPRIDIRTDTPGNLFDHDKPMRLTVELRDRVTHDLRAIARVFDASDNLVYESNGPIEMAAGAISTQLLGQIDLPLDRAGWYRVDVSVDSRGTTLASETLSVVRLPARTGVTADSRLGLDATALDHRAWEGLSDVAVALGAGRLKLSVWGQQGSIDQEQIARAFDRLTMQLEARRLTVTACLTGVPPQLAATLGQGDLSQLATASPDLWRPQIAYIVSRHAGRIAHWQVLADADAERFASEAPMQEAYRRIADEFHQLIGRPDLSVPWPAWAELPVTVGDARSTPNVRGADPHIPTGFSLNVAPSILPEQLPLYASIASATKDDAESNPAASSNDPNAPISSITQDGPRIGLALVPIDRSIYGAEQQRSDLARRVAFALASGAERIDLPLPFRLISTGRSNDRVRLDPDPLLPTYRAILSQLAGAQYRGRVKLAPQVEAMLFERGDDGIVLLWRPDGPVRRDSTVIRIMLGGRPTLTNLEGESTRLTETYPRSGEVDIPLGSEPIFISGVDAALMRLRASVNIDQPLLESSFKTHQRELRLTNSFPQAIAGSIRVIGPSGWSTQLTDNQFSLNPGETARMPLSIEFPLNSFAGEKTLLAEIRIAGGREQRLLVPVTITLGLADVGLQTLAFRDGDRIFVQQVVTNYGRSPIEFTAFVQCPGVARQERVINDLAPGRTTIKRYRFEAPRQPIESIRSGLSELDGPRVLNEEVPLR